MKSLNLQLVKKDTKTWKLVLTRNGSPEDISGWSLYFTAKTNFNDLDNAAIITKNVTFPNNAESQAGIGYLSLTSIDTDVAVGESYYDFKLIDTGYRETFLSGKLNIVRTIRLT
jgi:hypothetical protein